MFVTGYAGSLSCYRDNAVVNVFDAFDEVISSSNNVYRRAVYKYNIVTENDFIEKA